MSTYCTSVDHVLFTVLDQKVLTKLAKIYNKQIDELYNEKEEIPIRKRKMKIGKEFFISDVENIPQFFDIEKYIEDNRTLLKNNLKGFLFRHGWTEAKLCDYFTKNNSFIMPITKIIIE